jgi:ubiquinone/menaquinone biosynthesis C-methylase UbiE
MKYYDEVSAYYDKDASDFEKRYWKNKALQRIRQAFREEVKRQPFQSALEVGIGPGFDLIHFAKLFPVAQVDGIDVSGEMVNLAHSKLESLSSNNARVAVGSVENIGTLFPNQKYDLIYVFFGALNTVEDLPKALEILKSHLNPQGRMVLTFVNKWYLGGMIWECLKLKPKTAFSRLKKVWGGYSPTEFLASRCYSSTEIKSISKALQLKCLKREGFSIFFPAWYYHRLHKLIPDKGLYILWQADRAIAKGPLGSFGEYALYDLRLE